MKRSLLVLLCCGWIQAVFAQAALAQAPSAQAFPSKPIRVLTPYPPGGAVDVVARSFAGVVGESIGQPVIVENRVGGATMVSMLACAKAPPDGYTLCLSGADSLSYVNSLYSSVPYDPDRDFIGVARLLFTKGVVFANSQAPFSSFREMIAYTKANPGKINYATWGAATPPHIFMEWFQRSNGASFVHIPYKGGIPANTAVLANEAQVGYFAIGQMLPHFKSGKLRALAVTSAARSPALPDVPTLAEEGADSGLRSYMAIYAAAKTPPSVVDKLNAEFTRAIKHPRVDTMMQQQHLDPAGTTVADFNAFMKTDRENARKVFARLGIKPMDAPN
jgi:tripartite-type tricarboxylate transporter receptor subunit TctC